VDGEVAGFFELAQVDDQVAGGEPGHVLQVGEGQRAAAGLGREGRDDLQPGGDVDQRVKLAGGRAGRGDWWWPAGWRVHPCLRSVYAMSHGIWVVVTVIAG
jgi:hypothetical protein